MYTFIVTDPADQIHAEGIWANYELADWDRDVLMDKLGKEHPDFSVEIAEINPVGRLQTDSRFTILFDAKETTGEHCCFGLFRTKEEAAISWLAEPAGYGHTTIIPFSF